MFASLLTLMFAPPPVSFSERTVAGLPVRTIEVRAMDPRVRVSVVVAQGFPGGDEAFGSMLARTKPVAAINGAYFAKDTKYPIGDIVVGGEVIHQGRMGTALTITADRKLDIRRVERHRTQDWSAFETVLACGPALILDGKVDVQFEQEGFRDPHVTGRTQRMGVGIRADGALVLAHIRRPVSFREAATVFQGLGCTEAMNLDGGASLAMSFRGRVIQAPGRRLTNLLAVWVSG